MLLLSWFIHYTIKFLSLPVTKWSHCICVTCSKNNSLFVPYSLLCILYWSLCKSVCWKLFLWNISQAFSKVLLYMC